jgi:hypothetical protein
VPAVKAPNELEPGRFRFPPAATTSSPSGSGLKVPAAFRVDRYQFGFGRFDVEIGRCDSESGAAGPRKTATRSSVAATMLNLPLPLRSWPVLIGS